MADEKETYIQVRRGTADFTESSSDITLKFGELFWKNNSGVVGEQQGVGGGLLYIGNGINKLSDLSPINPANGSQYVNISKNEETGNYVFNISKTSGGNILHKARVEELTDTSNWSKENSSNDITFTHTGDDTHDVGDILYTTSNLSQGDSILFYAYEVIICNEKTTNSGITSTKWKLINYLDQIKAIDGEIVNGERCSSSTHIINLSHLQQENSVEEATTNLVVKSYVTRELNNYVIENEDSIFTKITDTEGLYGLWKCTVTDFNKKFNDFVPKISGIYGLQYGITGKLNNPDIEAVLLVNADTTNYYWYLLNSSDTLKDSVQKQLVSDGVQIAINDMEGILEHQSGCVGTKQLKDGSVTADKLGENIVSGLVQQIKEELVNHLYPVGTVYITFNDTEPSTLFPGTKWSRIEDYFLLGYKPSDNAAVGTIGGEATHRLTEDEMPAHRHYINDAGNNHWYETDNSYVQDGHQALVMAINGNGTFAEYVTGVTGSSSPHNNMPPYILVYMWRRTE